LHSRNACFVIIALGVLVFAGTLAHPFVHDDIVFILQNPQVHSFDRLPEIFTRSSITPQNVIFANPYYRPLLDVLYRVEYFLFGPVAWGYHAVNILFHVLNGILVFFVILKLTGRQRLSLGVSLLFIAHPVQTEAVACISGISNLLFTFLCLSSFLLYLKLTEDRRHLSIGQEVIDFGGALVLFGLALLTKEQAIVLPVLIALYEFCFAATISEHGQGWRLRLSGFAIVAGGYLLWRKVILGGFITAFSNNTGELYLRLKAIPGMILDHLRVVVFPYDLHYYRSYDILSPWVLPLAVLLAVAGCVWACYRFVPVKDRRLVGFGIGWFFISILPTMIVPLIHEYSWVAHFEHFLYVPVIGLFLAGFILADHIADRIFRQRSPMLKRIFVTVMLFGAMTVTLIQNRVWAGEIPLFEQAVRHQPDLGRVRLLLGKAYFANRDLPKAKKEFQVAQIIMNGYLKKIQDERLRPFYEGFLRDALLGEAACEEGQQNFTGAKLIYQRVLRFLPKDSASHVHLGFLAVRVENWDEAVLHFEKVLAAEPANFQVLTNLGVCYIHQGKADQAEAAFRKVLQLQPGFIPAKNNLEQLLKQKVKS